jgi:DNA-binding NarL/FixJ family response regulator
MVMPRMGGAELAQKLKALRPGLKVVLMSGYTDYSDPNKGANSVEAVMIPKPFSQGSLVEAVRGAMESKSSEQGAPRGLGS